MGRWPRRLVASVVALAAVTGLFVGRSEAQEVTPALTVTPSTQLEDFQFVTVTGTGFTPSITVTLEQCAAATAGDELCDPLTAVGTAAVGDEFIVEFRVRRFLLANQAGGGIDCAAAPGACIIRAHSLFGELATAPISFDPDAPLLSFSIRIGPVVRLLDGGFRAEVSGSVRCSQPLRLNLFGGLSQVGVGGSFITTFVNCDGKTRWQASVERQPTETPFVSGGGMVQVIADCPASLRCDQAQAGATRDVRLVGDG
jgi:Neocarzinostatin family